MKILLLDVNYKYSSTGKLIFDLKNKYEKLGHHAYASYGRGKKRKEKNVIKHSNKISVYIHALITRIFGYVGYGNFINTEFLIRKIIKIKPDIIHLHSLHGYHLNMYRLLDFINKKKINTVLTLHDTEMFTGKCGHTFDCERWKTGCYSCPQLKTYPKSIIFDRTKYEFNIKYDIFNKFENLHVTSVSNWLAAKAQKSKILGHHNITTVHNGVDLSIFYPRLNHNIPRKNKMILLFVTPNFDDPTKGGRYVKILSESLSKFDIMIRVVGPANNKRDNENIKFYDKISNNFELANHYSAADYTLMLSRLETFSMVTLESIACGTPVIGFDSLGPKEIASDNFGHFVKNGDISSLTNLIIDLYKNKFKLANLNECHEHATKKFSSSIMSHKYLKIYDSMINSEGK